MTSDYYKGFTDAIKLILKSVENIKQNLDNQFISDVEEDVKEQIYNQFNK